MSFLMASLACSNSFGRAPRRRPDPAAQGFCGPARDLRPGPTATLVSSTALVPLEASWAVLVRFRAAHKALVTSDLKSSIHYSSSQYPGTRDRSRRTYQAVTERDCSQSRSSGLISGGM